MLRDNSELGIGRKDLLETIVRIVIVICVCDRIAVAVAESVELWRVKGFGKCRRIAIVVYPINRRVHISLEICSGIRVVLPIARKHAVHPYLEPRIEFLIQPHAEVETAVVVRAVVHYAVLIVVVHSHRPIGPVVGPRKVDGVVVSHSRADKGGIPVGVASIVGHRKRSPLFIVRVRKVKKLDILLCVRQFHYVRRNLNSGISIVGNVRPPTRPLPRGDEYDAVGRPNAVNGSSRSILENCERFDVPVREEIYVINEDPIDDIERVCIVTD